MTSHLASLQSSMPANAGQVFIEHLSVNCIIGILPHERQHSQPVSIELSFDLDLKPAATSGDLSRSIDYAEAAEQVRQVLEHGRFELLEAAALKLADRLLALYLPATAVHITLRKPKALLGGAIAGVRLTKRRDD